MNFLIHQLTVIIKNQLALLINLTNFQIVLLISLILSCVGGLISRHRITQLNFHKRNLLRQIHRNKNDKLKKRRREMLYYKCTGSCHIDLVDIINTKLVKDEQDNQDEQDIKDTEKTEKTVNSMESDSCLKHHEHRIFVIDKNQTKKLGSKFSKERILLVYISIFNRIESMARRLKPLLPAISLLMAASFLIKLEDY